MSALKLRDATALSGYPAFGRNLVNASDRRLLEAMANASASIGLMDQAVRTLNQLPEGVGSSVLRGQPLRFTAEGVQVIGWREESNKLVPVVDELAPVPARLKHALDDLTVVLSDLTADYLAAHYGPLYFSSPGQVASPAGSVMWAVVCPSGRTLHTLTTSRSTLVAGCDFIRLSEEWLLFLRNPYECGIFDPDYVLAALEPQDTAPFSALAVDACSTEALPLALQARRREPSLEEISRVLAAATNRDVWGVDGEVEMVEQVLPSLQRVTVAGKTQIYRTSAPPTVGVAVRAHDPTDGSFKLLPGLAWRELDWSATPLPPIMPLLRGLIPAQVELMMASVSEGGKKILIPTDRVTDFNALMNAQEQFMNGQEAWDFFGLAEGESLHGDLFELGLHALASRLVILSTAETATTLRKLTRSMLPCRATLVCHTPPNAD